MCLCGSERICERVCVCVCGWVGDGSRAILAFQKRRLCEKSYRNVEALEVERGKRIVLSFSHPLTGELRHKEHRSSEDLCL